MVKIPKTEGVDQANRIASEGDTERSPREVSLGVPFPEQGHAGGAPELFDDSFLGDPTIPAEELKGYSKFLIARHLLVLLARDRNQVSQAERLQGAATLLFQLGDPDLSLSVLKQMGELGRVVDVYPLEILVCMAKERPGYFSSVDFEEFVLNKEAIENRAHEVGALIELAVPLAVKVRAFAVEGGVQPGYALLPGRPGTYVLEVWSSGNFDLLLLGLLRKRLLVDRVQLSLAEA